MIRGDGRVTALTMISSDSTKAKSSALFESIIPKFFEKVRIMEPWWSLITPPTPAGPGFLKEESSTLIFQ